MIRHDLKINYHTKHITIEYKIAQTIKLFDRLRGCVGYRNEAILYTCFLYKLDV